MQDLVLFARSRKALILVALILFFVAYFSYFSLTPNYYRAESIIELPTDHFPPQNLLTRNEINGWLDDEARYQVTNPALLAELPSIDIKVYTGFMKVRIRQTGNSVHHAREAFTALAEEISKLAQQKALTHTHYFKQQILQLQLLKQQIISLYLIPLLQHPHTKLHLSKHLSEIINQLPQLDNSWMLPPEKRVQQYHSIFLPLIAAQNWLAAKQIFQSSANLQQPIRLLTSSINEINRKIDALQSYIKTMNPTARVAPTIQIQSSQPLNLFVRTLMALLFAVATDFLLLCVWFYLALFIKVTKKKT